MRNRSHGFTSEDVSWKNVENWTLGGVKRLLIHECPPAGLKLKFRILLLHTSLTCFYAALPPATENQLLVEDKFC